MSGGDTGHPRRQRSVVAALSALLALPALLPAQQELRIGLVLPEAGDRAAGAESARRGAELGAEEGARLARLLGGGLELEGALAPGPEGAVAAARRLIRERGVFALVGGFDTESCAALGELAEREGVLFLNVGCEDDSLRRDRCWRNTFHVAASAAMRRAAGEGATTLWHPNLYRYGASQLNDRFGARFGREMDGTAWASWFAVKALAESALRTRSTDAEVLSAHLAAARTRFDGHKGRSLSFRPWDHQLRQPLYLLSSAAEGAEALTEAPAGRPAPGQSTEEFLDRIGDPADRTGCRRP